MVRDRRRSRRRRAVGRDATRIVVVAAAAAFVVVLVVGAVADVGPASVPFHRTLAKGFATLASPIAVQSNATGAALAATMSGVATTTRPALFAALDKVASDAAGEASLMDAAGSPPTAGGSSAGCVAAMDGRARATAGIRDALGGLLGGPTGTGPAAGDQPSAVRALDAAAADLQGADASWASCRRALLRQSRTARVPPSTCVADPAVWDATALAAYVAAVTRLSSLAPAPHLAITALTSVPPAVVTGAGPGVLPPSSTLVVRVVVTNGGNVDEQGVRVGAAASAVGASPPAGPAVSSSVDVTSGWSVAVTLPAIGVQPGGTYTVVVTATDATGVRAAATITVAVSAPPPTTTTTTTTTTAPARTTTTTAPGRTTTTTRHALRRAAARPRPAGGTVGPNTP